MKLFDFPLFPESASTLAGKVDAIYFFALAVSAFFSLLIAVFIFFFFVRYRRKSANEVGDRFHSSMLLEVTWSVIPLAITMVLFAWGAVVFLEAVTPPPGAKEYFATGKQWMWKIQHPEGQREINSLHIPVGKPIKMTMTSEDVIHSFYIPAFRIKQDVLPGRYTTLWFEATKTGTYHLFCAEYCGAEHSKMIGTVTVMEQGDYQAWLAETSGTAVAEAGGGSLGEQLFSKYTCDTCHFQNDSGRGPSLVGILGEEVKFTDGTTQVRDESYLRESILQPNAKVVEGYLQIMPTFQGQISEVGIRQLIGYIQSLDPTYVPPAETEAASAEPAVDETETPTTETATPAPAEETADLGD